MRESSLTMSESGAEQRAGPLERSTGNVSGAEAAAHHAISCCVYMEVFPTQDMS